MIGLSAIPCSMGDSCCAEEKTMVVGNDNKLQQVEGVTGQPKSDQKKSAKIPCSPLFACGAHAGFILPNLFVLEHKEVIVGTSASKHPIHDFKPFLLPASIWRPPLVIG